MAHTHLDACLHTVHTCIGTCIHVPVDAKFFTCFLSSFVQLHRQQALSQEEDSYQWDARGSDNEGSGGAC